MQFADRLNNVETSAIRELFKLLGKPGIISFAGGFPDSAMFDVEGIRAASNAALTEEPGAALQYGATEGYNPLREQLAALTAKRGSTVFFPRHDFCTDNAAMIAYAGWMRRSEGRPALAGFPTRARWPLTELTAPPSI